MAKIPFRHVATTLVVTAAMSLGALSAQAPQASAASNNGGLTGTVTVTKTTNGGLTGSVSTSNRCSETKVNTNVSLYRPFPEGLPANNAQLAMQKVLGRALWDSGYANQLACETGATKFIPKDYRATGYLPQASKGTTNSGITANGVVVPVKDHNGSQYVRVLEVLNWKTQKVVQLMVRCGNPRLYTVAPLPWKPFSKGVILVVRKTVTKNVSHVCKDGQKIFVTMTTTINGIVHATSWGKAQGNLNLSLRQRVNEAVRSEAQVTCGKTPVKEVVKYVVRVITKHRVVVIHRSVVCPSGTKLSAGNCVIQKVTCRSGSTMDSAGNCVVNQQNAAQQCAAKGGSYNTSNGLCTIIEVVGTCSTVTVINGSGNTVNSSSSGNCNSTTTTTVPPPPPPPTPVCYLNGTAEFSLPSGYEVLNGACVPIPPPPTNKPAPNCWFNIIQEGYISTTAGTAVDPISLTCWAPAGDSVTITLNAGTASLSQSTIQFSATGSNQVLSGINLLDPTEVQTVTVTAHVVDNTTNEVQTPDPTVAVPIILPPANPGA